MSHYLNVTKTDNQRNNKTVIASMESMLNKLDESRRITCIRITNY